MLSNNTNNINNYSQILSKATVVDIDATNKTKATVVDIEANIKTNLTDFVVLKEQIKVTNSNETKFCPANAGLYCCAGFVVLSLVLPFIFCDLYYAYNSISCQHDETPMGISLSTWLKVSGFSAVGVISTLILIFISNIY